MNKKKRLTTVFVVMAMFCMMSMSVLAATNVVISLPKDQAWTTKRSMTRTGNYSYVQASCDSVYPTDGSTDLFSKIQARIINSSGTLIMTKDYVSLKEGDGYQDLNIKEGYLADKTVYIQFRGNTNSAAEAVVNYQGL